MASPHTCIISSPAVIVMDSKSNNWELWTPHTHSNKEKGNIPKPIVSGFYYLDPTYNLRRVPWPAPWPGFHEFTDNRRKQFVSVRNSYEPRRTSWYNVFFKASGGSGSASHAYWKQEFIKQLNKSGQCCVNSKVLNARSSSQFLYSNARTQVVVSPT